MLEKQIIYDYSITENGNIQVRQVTEQAKPGKAPIKKLSDPMTPANINDMTGWDKRSKDIVSAIIDSTTVSESETEKNGIFIDEGIYIHSDNITGIGIEEAISFDRKIKPYCEIFIRRIYRVFDEGVEVSKRYHRGWIMPGDASSNNDVISKAVTQKLYTPAVIATYKNKMVEQVAGAK